MCVYHQVACEVEMKRMCLAQANADLTEAAEKLQVIRRKLAVSLLSLFWIESCFLSKDLLSDLRSLIIKVIVKKQSFQRKLKRRLNSASCLDVI